MTFKINNKQETDEYLYSLFSYWRIISNPTRMSRKLFNARRILNKYESEYLYNYMTNESEYLYNYLTKRRRRFSNYIIELDVSFWWECFKNYLLAEGAELTKIENELIMEEMIKEIIL